MPFVTTSGCSSRFRDTQSVACISRVRDRVVPIAMGNEPLYRALEPIVQRSPGTPAELASDLRRVHRVAHVVSRTISDVGDQRLVRRVASIVRDDLLQQIAQGAHELEVRRFTGAADVVRLAYETTFHDRH